MFKAPRSVAVLTGAGISAESGIETFRATDGLWANHPVEEVATPEGFARNPQKVYDFYNQRRQQLLSSDIKPNAAHTALAKFEYEFNGSFLLITQNVDNLHFEAGSRSVAEIHGNRTKIRCIDCNLRLPRDDFLVFPDELPPRCPECRGIVKGDGVMFGEPIPADVLEVCYKQTSMSDCMIVVGTSATVFPAASFPSAVWQDVGHLIEINPFETPLTHYSKVVLRGESGEILPLLTEEVGRRLPKEEI